MKISSVAYDLLSIDAFGGYKLLVPFLLIMEKKSKNGRKGMKSMHYSGADSFSDPPF